MTSFSRRARHLCLILPVLLLTGTVAEARTPVRRAATAAKPTPKAPVPWLYRGSDVPQDKEWIFGELPNGLRYAVRRNGRGRFRSACWSMPARSTKPTTSAASRT